MEKLKSIFSFMHGNALVLIISNILSWTSLNLGWPYFSLYIMALGGSPTIVGLVYAIGVLAGLPTFPIGGYIADYKGRVKLVAISTYLEALSFLFFIFAKNWAMMVAGLFLWQLIGVYYPIISAIMADSLLPDTRGIGFATIMALPNIAGAIVPFFSGFLVDLYGSGYIGVRVAMPICWAMSLIIGLLSGTIRLKFLKETLEKTDLGVSFDNVALFLKASYESVLESMKWMSKPLWAITVVNIITTFFVSIAAPFWIIYATSIIGLNASSWGALIFLLGMIQIGLSILMGHLVDRFGARRLIIIALFLAVFPVFSFTFCRTFLEVFIALLFLVITNSIIWPAFSALKANLIPRERRGRILSILGQGGESILWSGAWASGLIQFIPMSAGMLIGGYIYDANPKYPWYILSVAIIFCLILTFKFIHEPEKPEI